MVSLDSLGHTVYHSFVTKRALLIVNPAARGAPPIGKLRAAAEALNGWETSLNETSAAGDATDMAREAARMGIDVVVACGGDGTVNEVANGLAGSETALAAVRGGTANVWAKEIGLPKDPAKAIGLLPNGDRRTVDLGLAGDRYFLLMAGIGFDASIVQRVSSSLKRRLGAIAYAIPAIGRAFGHRAVEADLVVDGEPKPSPLYWLLLGNTRNYGGVLGLTHMARTDDGLLDVCLLQHGGPPRLAWLALWALFKRHQHRAEVVYEKVRSLDVQTPGLPVQIDGEYLGETPMTFSVAPGALHVIVPHGSENPMFSVLAKD